MNAKGKKSGVEEGRASARLMRDIKQVMGEEIEMKEQGLYYRLENELNVKKGYLMVIGREGTPYENGFYFFTIELPNSYPFDPPKVTFMTVSADRKRIHPSFKPDGSVCLSILTTHFEGNTNTWAACINLKQVCIILALQLSINVLQHEPGYELKGEKSENKQYETFDAYVQYENLKYAVGEQLINPGTVGENVWEKFREIMEEKFLSNYERYQEKAVRLVEEYPDGIKDLPYELVEVKRSQLDILLEMLAEVRCRVIARVAGNMA